MKYIKRVYVLDGSNLSTYTHLAYVNWSYAAAGVAANLRSTKTAAWKTIPLLANRTELPQRPYSVHVLIMRPPNPLT